MRQTAQRVSSAHICESDEYTRIVARIMTPFDRFSGTTIYIAFIYYVAIMFLLL